MISATLDSNVYISALIFRGKPNQLLQTAIAGDIDVAVSQAILEETMRVLREKFGWSVERVQDAAELISGFARHVTPTAKLTVVKDDPDDDKIIECAATAGSDYLVTGDKGILKVGSHGKTQMVTPARFLDILRGRGR